MSSSDKSALPRIDFGEVEENIKASYRAVAAKYRTDDEVEVTTEHHRHLRGILGTLSTSFGRPIRALDVGCGTGRYFYCLKNVDSLLGIDISEEMLRAAENPVRRGDVSVKRIELRCMNAYLGSFPSESFDLIYSLGMFGYGCPVTVELCNKFSEWLAPGGKLFFDAVDIVTLPLWCRARREIRNRAYAFLPQRWKNALDRRSNGVPFFGLGRKALERIMRASQFSNFSVASRVCQSPLWQGSHLECAASKSFMTKQPQWPG
jgi:SAM-dependent methyltransferase